ncbi:MAG: hypothetical protein ABI224_10975, partial [Acetobacteraceae bacterium]
KYRPGPLQPALWMPGLRPSPLPAQQWAGIVLELLRPVDSLLCFVPVTASGAVYAPCRRNPAKQGPVVSGGEKARNSGAPLTDV